MFYRDPGATACAIRATGACDVAYITAPAGRVGNRKIEIGNVVLIIPILRETINRIAKVADARPGSASVGAVTDVHSIPG